MNTAVRSADYSDDGIKCLHSSLLIGNSRQQHPHENSLSAIQFVWENAHLNGGRFEIGSTLLWNPCVASFMVRPTVVFGTRDKVIEKRRRRSFGALSHYPVFRHLWLASLAVSLGQWMQQVALGWLALTLTDSPGFVGLVGLMGGVPFLLVSLPGGILIDRMDRRRLMLSIQASATLVALVVATDVLAGWVQPWHLLIAAFFNGSLQAVLNPAQQSLVPTLVDRSDLTQAVGLMSAGQNLTRVVGPSIAGAIIAVADVGPAFLVQGIAIGVAFSIIRGIAIPARSQAATGTRNVFQGIVLIFQRSDLRGLFLLAAIPTFLVFPYIQFLSVLARDVLKIGAGGLGLLLAASGFGAVVGSLLTATRRRSRPGRFVVRSAVGYGVVILGIAVSRSLVITLPLLAVAGLMGASFMTTNNALLQHRISDDVRGRVMGAYLLTWGLMALGAMPMGLVADRAGTPTAIAAGAIVSSVLSGLVGYGTSSVKSL